MTGRFMIRITHTPGMTATPPPMGVMRERRGMGRTRKTSLDLSGYYWKLIKSTLTTGAGADCIPIGADLSMPINCVSYNGTRYGFTLRFYENPYDRSGLYWKMDGSTLVVK